jgi:membrane protein YqaA with SNARE-associated domain
MTLLRFALTGAVLFNLPNLFAVSVLPASAVALSVVLLAVAGAALGAMIGWAITSRIDAAVAAVRVEAPATERLAA